MNNPEPLQLVIIAFILVTLICDSGVIFKGEIKFWSLLRVKRLKICNLVKFILRGVSRLLLVKMMEITGQKHTNLLTKLEVTVWY